MSTFLALLLGLISVGSSAPPPLRVEIVFEGARLPERLERSAMDEVAVIWAPYGVDVHAGHGTGDAMADTVKLSVTILNRANKQTAVGTLGSIRFVDDLPKPAISMYPTVIARLVATAKVLGRHEAQLPMYYQEILLGRVFGRALAHEIGHFLLRSPHHSGIGLMRAQQPIDELAAPQRQGFTLSDDDAMHLAQTLSTLGR